MTRSRSRRVGLRDIERTCRSTPTPPTGWPPSTRGRRLGGRQARRRRHPRLRRPLAQYLDSPPVHPGHPDIPLTVQHLVTHTSGIRDGSTTPTSCRPATRAFPTYRRGGVLDPGGEFYTGNMWGRRSGRMVPIRQPQLRRAGHGHEGATGMRFDEIMKRTSLARSASTPGTGCGSGRDQRPRRALPAIQWQLGPKPTIRGRDARRPRLVRLPARHQRRLFLASRADCGSALKT